MTKGPFNLPSNRSVAAGSFNSNAVAIGASPIMPTNTNNGQQPESLETVVAPAPQRRFLGWIQVRALVGKNLLSKRRTPVGTFFEIFSPVLMMIILVAAYQLSEITTKEAQQYDAFAINLPGPYLDLITQAISVLGDGGLDDLDEFFSRQRRRQLRSSPSSSTTSNGSTTLLSSVHGVDLLQDLGLTPPSYRPARRRLQTENGGANNSTTTDDNDQVFDFLDGTSDQLTTLLASPVPVPTFNQFVTASLGLSSIIDADNLPIILSDSSYGRSFGNLLTLGTLHLSPDVAVVHDFAAYLNATYSNATMEAIKIRIHSNEREAVSFITNNLNERTWALLDFDMFNDAGTDDSKERPNDVSYKIRMNYTTLPNTNQIVNFISIGRDSRYERYYLSGFLTLQRTMNEFAMSRTEGCGGDSAANTANIWSMVMPTAAYNQNSFFQAVGFLLGLTMAMAFLYPTSRTIKTIVEEKELRLKETLYILGVRPWAHWLSWLLTSLITFSIIAFLVTWILTANILTHSNPVYILVYIAFFSSATIGFCFVVAACFSRAKLAAIIGPMALFATLLPRFIFFGSNRYEAIAAKKWASLLPCTAFAFGADIIADYEYGEVGVQSWNASVGEYSFNTAVGFLFIDTLLYIFLGWYLELVIPRQYGVARPFYFLLLPSYWESVLCGCSGNGDNNNSRSANPSPGVVVSPRGDVDEAGTDALDFEPVTDSSWVPRVDIRDLVKRYSKNPVVPAAVNHLNLTLYESQITCLLGHNGAGKSSTISVLTGLYPPTSGDCFIYGNSIVHDTSAARHSMGVCPQHNVLFDQLTVMEHLAFFQKVKGLKPTKGSLRQSAHEIGLGDYLRTTSLALSGGNKRKLSLAIALCGDPQFLLLDEPTSGMDVASRRNCWELLRRKRQGRVTLLTTHFLDEASLLADRIAVMKEGKLQCYGSELFLKNRFGLGYNLTVVLAVPESVGSVSPHVSTMYDGTESLINGTISSASANMPSSSNSPEDITAFLNRYIPDTKLIRKSARELTFRFPQGSEASFPEAFDALEEERSTLCIGAYGITDTTLEEIFLQLAETEETPLDRVESTEQNAAPIEAFEWRESEDNKPAAENQVESNDDLHTKHETEEEAVSHEDLHPINPFRQIALLYRKRFVIQRRDLKGACFQIILPVLLCGLVLLVLTIDVVLAGPPIEMSMGLYESDGAGSSAATDVVIGGGMTLETADARRLSTIDDDFNEIKATFRDQYPNAKFVHLTEAVSSSDISQHLLDTYNDHNHSARYGSLALYDRISVNISVDWNEMRKDLRKFMDSTIDWVGMVEVGPLLGTNGTLIELNVTLPEVRDFVAQLTNSTENTTITVDTVLLLSTTQGALQRIVDSAFASDATGVEDLREVFIDLIQSVNAVQAGNTDLTLLDAVTDLLNNLLTTVTDGVIQDINGTTVDEVAAVLVRRVEIFNRSVIIEGMLEIFDVLLEPYGGTRDTSQAIVNLVIDTFDGAASLFSSNLTAAPNDLLILPVLLLDGFAEELFDNFGANATISLGDVFDTIEETVGDVGYVYVKVESASVDLSSQRVVLKGTRIEIMSEVLVSDKTVELDMSILVDAADALLPSGSGNFLLGFNSDVSILHNSSSPHAVGAFNQAYMEYLFKQCTAEPLTSRLVSVNHPLPLTDQQAIEIKTILSVLASLFLLIPLCYIPGAFVVFIVKERMSKSKHLQLVSGVELTSYWVSSYLWDLTLFLILTLLLMGVFFIYGRDSAVVFVGDAESALASFVLVFGYGLSILPFSYLLSRLFNNHSSAQIAVMGIIFITGFVAVNAYFIMSTIASTKNLAETLRPIFRWWPAYNIGEGFIQLSTSYWEREILGSERYPLDWDVAGKPIVLNLVLSFPYFLYLLLLEYSDDGGAGGFLGRILRQMRSAWGRMILRWHGVRKGPDGVSLLLDDGLDGGRGEDDDVVDEQMHVEHNKDELKGTASVLLVNMWKVFPPTIGPFGKVFSRIGRIFTLICYCGCFRKHAADVEDDEEEDDKSNLPKRAIRGVSTAIMQGETYGLLGVNGAGKTTTLGVLTGDIAPTGGEAYVAGHDVTGITPGGVAAARKHIGFCPQVDPLLDLMTGRETLCMFGRLRGIPEDRLEATVTILLGRLTLTPHADKVSESYSGGNKRKLSLGVALIGDPRVLFIDEASSGMDPCTRRKTWELIEQAAETRSIILTSHSMEEVEALCTRVGIMVKGQFLCLGSVQHLKTKYLDGYTIDVQSESGAHESDVDAVVNKILAEILPDATLAERHGRFMRFDVSSIGLGATFRKLQELKRTMAVANYSISQCSLEQVFIKLVKSGNAEVVDRQSNNPGLEDVEDIGEQDDGQNDGRSNSQPSDEPKLENVEQIDK